MAPYSAEALIDLTLDSDDEPSPVDSSVAHANPQPQKMAVPLPGSASRFPQQATPRSLHPTVFNPTAPSHSSNDRSMLFAPTPAQHPPIPTAYTMSANSNAPTANGTHASNGYVPVFNDTTAGGGAGDFHIPQAEKRRKVMTSTPPASAESRGPIRKGEEPKQKFYGVKVGHVPGVYTDWNMVKQQITGCKGALQFRFDTRKEAQAFVDGTFMPQPDRSQLSRPQVLANGGAPPPPVGSPLANSGLSAKGKQPAAPAYPRAPSRPVATAPAPTVKPESNGLQSFNMASITSGVNMPFAGRTEELYAPRKLHLERISNTPSAYQAANPSSSGLAIAQSSTDEMVVDQDPSILHPQLMLGRPPMNSNASSASNPSIQNGTATEIHSVAEDLLDTLLEDDVLLELLSQAPANDKVALLLNASSRGQAMARNIQFQPAQNKDTRTASAPQSLFNAGSPSAPARSDRDSVYSDSDTPNARASLSRKQSASSVPAARSVIATIEQTSARPKWTGGLSEAEAHLLIFLKEVNKLRWTEITEKFQEHYPHRSYGVLQTNYSQKINRRDRTQDPPALILPACYAAETRISWDEVHAGPSRPNDHSRQRKRDVEILREQLRHQTQPSALPAWSAAVESLQEPSSGAESSSLAKRPRRAVPVKNYTWPKRNTLPRDESFDGVDHDMLESVEDRLVQSESPEDLVPAPEKAIAVDNEPLSVEFEEDDASLGLITQSRNAASNPQHLPYLSSPQRSSLQDATRGLEWDQLVSRNWQGTLIHVDFSPAELTLVEGALTRLVDSPRALRVPGQQRRLQRLLSGLTEPKFLRLTNALRSKLPSRDRRSIEAFLYDARDGRIRSRDPRVERMAAARPDQSFSSDAKLSVSSMIRRRETDVQSHRGWSSGTRPLSYQLKNKVQDSLGPVSSYTGASSDVHAVAWSIDGQCFAAGAICVDDPHSLQYNRSNNLLYGDVSYNTINELGKHHVMRPKPESGPNSTHAMYSSQDPKLYKTVTSVAFSPNGRYLFSSGYDQNVAVWETKYDGSQPTELVALHHKAEVTMMTVNSVGVLATGTEKCTGNAVKVIRLNDDDPSEAPATINFQSAKASERLDMKIKPIALHFSPRYENFLLGGFGASARQDGRDIAGDICLWDIDGQATLSIWGSGKNVFDLSFHPRQRWFAVGTVAGQNTNRGTRSTVRLYDEHNGGQHSKFSMSMELECRAQDINDVVWCPGDDFLLAAGCTSGRAYVWDVRNPNHFLRELAHGSSLMPLDEDIDRELTDTGVRFLTWGDNATRLYTGSSDGVVKVWNVVRSEEETFVKDLITLDSGIMSGAFSPDRSRLLLGEVNGSVNVLEVGRDDCSLKDAEKMRFIPYNGDFDDMQSTQSTTAADMDSGFATAKDLLETGQMVTVPMGGLPIRQAVQGPAYAGPFDTGVDAPFLREQALEMQLKMAETPASHCSIPTCQEAVSKITSEESGDSGRSADRIPDALRLQWETPPSHLAAVPGKTHCSNCGRTARPSPSSDEVFCERCAFSCFRCGAINQIAASTEIIQCYGCECVWDIGALGYDLVPTDKPGWAHSATAANFSGVPRLDGYSRELREARREAKSPLCESKTSFGDEMNALTDYYFSLAIDRPESPPL